MSKKISGAEYPLSEIFSSHFDYVIPHYQRPYAWTVDQASELFDDLYDFYQAEEDEGYFLGSIVLIKQEGKPYSEVIDGQQRLTTLTVLLSALTASLSGDLHNDFKNYIIEPGRASQGLQPKPRLQLRDKDKSFFAKYVQGFAFGDLLSLDKSSLANESQLNIQRNSKLMLDRIKQRFDANEASICEFGAFLVQRCYLVAVSTPSQQSAFRVFSVMNSRGLDLQPTDILKADILGQLNGDEADAYNERWEDMEVELGRNGFNDLFSYVRMIFAKEKAKRALLDEFKLHVIEKEPSPNKLIEQILEPHAAALAIVRQVNYEATSNAEGVNRYLRWLNRIDFSDWVPPAIAFLAEHKNNSAYTLWFFERLERLTAFMHVCAYNVNQRIERYAKLLAELEGEHGLENPLQTIELTGAEIDQFKAALGHDIYTLTARRRNYIILRLDSFMTDAAASYDPTILTIEHVLPQTVEAGTEWDSWWPEPEIRAAWVHKIANLVPLTQRRNSKAKNFDFKTKKEAYFGGKKGVSSYILTSQVLGEEDWTPDVLKSRQEALLSVFDESWRLGGAE